jgi:hypothetical protein
MERDIPSITSRLLMQERDRLIPWDDFAKIAEVQVCTKKHVRWPYYVSERLAVKNQIEEEIKLRKLPVRIKVTPRSGITLIETHVAEKEIENQFRKSVRASKNSIERWESLKEARGLSPQSVKMLDDAIDSLTFGQNAMAGAIMQVTEISAELKIEMMKTLGVGLKRDTVKRQLKQLSKGA